MSSDDESRIPLARVHLVKSDVPLGGPAAMSRVVSLKPAYRGSFGLVTLTVNDPAQEILPIDPARAYAFILAVDAAIIIGELASSVAAGVGVIVPQNVAWPVFHDGAVYAAALTALTGTTIARVSVQQAQER